YRDGVDRLILGGSEDLREEIRDELAGHHVRVGDSERPIAAIALRPGIGARGIWADAKPRAVEMQYGAAARRNRVNHHHRGAHAYACDLGLERALVFAIEMRHVGRGAAHVEADEVRETGGAPGLSHSNDPARGPG